MMKRIESVMYEIRFHGRGGQGVVTAATLLAEAAVLDGLWSQAIPFFGAERRGAPVVAFTRISDKPIRIHSQVYSPDMVVILDEKLLQLETVLKGLKSNGVIIVNSSKELEKLGKLNWRVFLVDATSIALRLGLIVAGWPIVNTAMLGAIAKTLGIISIDSIEKCIKMKWSGKIGEKNALAARLAYENVKEGGEK